MPIALVIGASRGLGAAMCAALLDRGVVTFGTFRSEPKDPPAGLRVLSGIDVGVESAGSKIVAGLDGAKLDQVWFVAGLLVPESLDKLDWQGQVSMYTICAIAPTFITAALVQADAFAPNAKLAIISSEGGSIALRTPDEGGGMHGHHGSKAAQNMAGRILSIDLRPRGIPVGLIHPGFMRTEMTENAFGRDAWDQGGAMQPEELVDALLEFVGNLTIDRTGSFWAPNGPRDIGQAENVLGKNLPTPLELPW